MRILGFEVQRVAKANVGAVPSFTTGHVSAGSIWSPIRELFAGSWQRDVVVDNREKILAFSAVYACVSLIADDIAKMRPKLVRRSRDNTWDEVENSAFSPVLRKPNRYQTRIQFFSAWVISKLIHGNTYILKERDARGVVVAMHILDPQLVTVKVAPDTSIYYDLSPDNMTGIHQQAVVPASEIIHDRAVCLYHPLIGVGPLYACGVSASQGNRIQHNSATFFQNQSRPSGMLMAPETITDETANRLKTEFEQNFSGTNIGRLLVLGDGLKYEAMAIPAQQAQLIEQLRWTVEDVARCFHVPLHKIASDAGGVKFTNMAQMNQDYYSQTLQTLIESIELLLDEGLGLTGGQQTFGVELDLEGLLRMDPAQRAERNQIAIRAGYLSPNEARLSENLPPVTGGESPFLQQQQFPLAALVQQPPPGSKAVDMDEKLAPILDSMRKTMTIALTRRKSGIGQIIQ